MHVWSINFISVLREQISQFLIRSDPLNLSLVNNGNVPGRPQFWIRYASIQVNYCPLIRRDNDITRQSFYRRALGIKQGCTDFGGLGFGGIIPHQHVD